MNARIHPRRAGAWAAGLFGLLCAPAAFANPQLPPTDSADAYGNTAVGPAAACNYVDWTRGVNYTLGTIVRYPPNGQFYKLVNVGTNGSDGTDPTISTWYWQPTTCDNNPQPGGFVVTEAQFNQMFPNRNPFYTYAGLVAAIRSYPQFAKEGGDTIARQEAAAFLANVNQETGGLVHIRELNQANWDHYCQPQGTCGGKQYYGRGPIQLSWNYNYAAAGNALGLDLLNNPDWVATNSAISWQTALWYWMTQRGGASNTPHQAMVNLRAFGETIRAINGGIECNATGIGHQQMLNRGQYYRNFAAV
ncbi:glycoside hydrolase family 19 protein, partial [Pseudomonas sp. CGJS7]|uniref:glycoside hydrolase family 19 protein n=1 Tax=Pseudomonas sp. CGJS7 TaxID=3109348 RepID=UPI00300814A1